MIEHMPDWLDRPIVIPEGEPKAERLVRLGYAAVTWCGGSNKVTRTLWGALAGRVIILWRDADSPGLKAMQQLATILEGLGCTVLWVSVPEGKPKGWDCVDATDAEIHRLIDAASANDLARPIEEMGRQCEDWPQALSPAAFQSLEIPPPSWALQGVLPENGASMIVSPPDGGKTTTVRTFAMAVAEGSSFLGLSVSPRAGLVWRFRGR